MVACWTYFPLHCSHLQEGWTALMAASRKGHLNIVDQLLVHGADLDMRDCVSDPLLAAHILPHQLLDLRTGLGI